MMDSFEIDNNLDPTDPSDAVDSDNDGLPDPWESFYGLSTSADDSQGDEDGDSLLNHAELEHFTSPLLVDTDYDTRSDYAEVTGINYDVLDSNGYPEYTVTYFPDPVLEDTDGDLWPDGWEILNAFDPTNAVDGNADVDNDGLTNGEEYVWDTVRYDPDTDNDGEEDGLEVANGTDPKNPNSNTVNPPDTDQDNLSDVWEMTYFGDLDEVETGNPDDDGLDKCSRVRSRHGSYK